jgi:hypothetical protein
MRKQNTAMELFPLVAALIATVASSYYLGTKHSRKSDDTIAKDEYGRDRIADKGRTSSAVTDKQVAKSHPNYVVLPALIPDISKVYDTYFSSFTNEKMAQLMLDVIFPGGTTGSEEFRKNHTAGTLAYWHVADTQYTFKCVDTQTGEIVGMALGDILLRKRSLEERRFSGIPWLEGKDREKAESVIGPLAEMREKLFADAPHICKFSIYLNPSDSQPRGISKIAHYSCNDRRPCYRRHSVAPGTKSRPSHCSMGY